MRLLPRDSGLGWTPFAWLIYLGFLFVEPAYTGAPSDWAVALASTGVFLALYFRAHWLEGRGAVPYVAAIVALGALVSPFNAGAVGFFIYGAGFVCRLGPPRVSVPWLVAIAALPPAEHVLVGIEHHAWAWATVFSLLVGGVNIHFAEAARSDARLRLAHAEVERLAQLNERERIARDLHDLLGHSLSVITLKAELAGRLVSRDPTAAEAEIRAVEAISRRTLSEVRHAVEGFREATLGAELPRAKLALASARIRLELETGPFALDTEREAVAALALREAVTNVIRHSRAATCRVTMGRCDGRFRLVVEDDGRGARGGALAEGSGLTGMRERVEAAGGSVRCATAGGWRLEVELPHGRAAPDLGEAVGA